MARTFPYTGSTIVVGKRERLPCFNFPFYKRGTKVNRSDMYKINFPRTVVQSCWTLVANSVLKGCFVAKMIWVLFLIVFVNLVQGCTVRVTRTERHKRFFPSSMLLICLQIGAQPPSTSQQFHNI